MADAGARHPDFQVCEIVRLALMGRMAQLQSKDRTVVQGGNAISTVRLRMIATNLLVRHQGR